MSMCSMQKGKI